MGNSHHIQVASSPDLVTWTYLGEALSLPLPAWYVGPNTWAPDVTLHNGTFFMYFGASGAPGMCIAVATCTSPAGPFVVQPQPVMCAPNFGDIDPKSYDDPASGTPYLYWGSDFQPIQVQALAANRTALAPGSSPVVVANVNASQPYENLVEGAWLHAAPANVSSAYYLFYSGDNCCGSGAQYAVMVAAAAAPTGPFTKLAAATGSASSVILSEGNGFVAPGHNSVVTDDAGQDWMLYHAYVGTPTGPRTLLIDRIQYVQINGMVWPMVGVPSNTSQVGPVVNGLAS